MDETGQGRWNTKLEQHRSIRAELFKQNLNPGGMYEEAKKYNGALIEDWTRIYLESWERKPPYNISFAAKKAKSQISQIIEEEEGLINSAIVGAFGPKPSEFYRQLLEAGKIALHQSCEVMKYKAFSAIDNKRADRTADFWKEFKTLVELGLAAFGVVLLWNQNRIVGRQTEILAKQESSAAQEREISESINSTKLHHRISELLDFYPREWKSELSKIMPWERRELFVKIENLLKSEESNPALVHNEKALTHWRRALAVAREIQTERIYLEGKSQLFIQKTGAVRAEIEGSLSALSKTNASAR